MRTKPKPVVRCGWATGELSIPYHDEEWGVPVHDDRMLFEFLILEGAQAGLSWNTILNKRANYRAAFDNFDPQKVARYDRRKIQQLLRDPGIVRNRLKIDSAVVNAKAFLRTQEEFGSFDRYVWQFVGGKPRVNSWKTLKQVPALSAESDALSKDLRRRGFKFVDSTICYAFMQAVGMVNDHAVDCLRYNAVSQVPQIPVAKRRHSLAPHVSAGRVNKESESRRDGTSFHAAWLEALPELLANCESASG
jgi:DNA-3-methyladenine glycosylase I